MNVAVSASQRGQQSRSQGLSFYRLGRAPQAVVTVTGVVNCYSCCCCFLATLLIHSQSVAIKVLNTPEPCGPPEVLRTTILWYTQEWRTYILSKNKQCNMFR